METNRDRLERIESLIRRDPARRGLLGSGGWQPGQGELVAAAQHLADHGRQVAIVTGFPVPNRHGIHAETDGPPGAVVLADVLSALGMNITLVADETCSPVVAVALDAAGLSPDLLGVCPLEATAAWCKEFLNRPLTHLISIEHVGPNHTSESLCRQTRRRPPPTEDFETLVPVALRNRCFNMRGDPLDAFTAPLYLLFDGLSAALPDARSIGIGDGGNELGMGKFPWEDLHPLVPGGHGPQMVCRVATDWTIVSGTCNWGGFALAAAVALLRGRPELITNWTIERQERLLQRLVHEAGAIDGVTREREATVDGLPFITYAQACDSIIAECLRNP